MQTRTFGKTGWNVVPVGFGAWAIGGQWGHIEHDTALETVRAAIDAGVNFFDNADAYGDPPGLAEERMGEALRGVRSKLFIATKAGNFARRAGHPLPFTSPLHVELCCDASLHRLQTDVIDLYQCHIADHLDVFLEAFDTLKRKGKIRAAGISTNSLDVLQKFNSQFSCAAVQLDYSLVNRSPEKDILPYALENGIAVIVRGPLAQGICTGKFTSNTTFTDSVRAGWNSGPERGRYLAKLELIEKLRFLEAPNRTLAATALQFVLAHPAVAVAIPGAKNPQQARGNVALGTPLTIEEFKTIDAVTAV